MSPSISQLTTGSTISQIIAADHQAKDLLASIGLEIERYKNESLRKVCQQRQWSEQEVLKWIKKQHKLSLENHRGDNTRKDTQRSSEYFLYLEKRYRVENLKVMNDIRNCLPRVLKIHSNQHGWLKILSEKFNTFEDKLDFYYRFESTILFPLLKTLDASKSSVLDGTIKKTERSLQIIIEDHEQLIQIMNVIRKKSRDFQYPEDACSTFRILNHHFKSLFEGLNEEIRLKQHNLIPLIKNRIIEISSN